MATNQTELAEYNVVICGVSDLSLIKNSDISILDSKTLTFKDKKYNIITGSLEQILERDIISINNYIYNVFKYEIISNIDFCKLMSKGLFTYNNPETVFTDNPNKLIEALQYITMGLKPHNKLKKHILKNISELEKVSELERYYGFVSMLSSNPITIKILKSYKSLEYFINNTEEFNYNVDLEILQKRLYYYFNKTESVNPAICMGLLFEHLNNIIGIPIDISETVGNSVYLINDLINNSYVDYDFSIYTDAEIVNAKVLAILICSTNPEIKHKFNKLMPHSR